MALPPSAYTDLDPLPAASYNELAKLAASRQSVSCTAGGTITLTSAQYQTAAIILTGSPGSAFNVVVPTDGGRWWIVSNVTGQTATVKTSGGAGVAIRAGKTTIVQEDGTDVLRCLSQADELIGSATWDPGSVSSGLATTTSVTVTGAAVGDYVVGVSHSQITTAAVVLTGQVTSANTVTVTLANFSGGAVDLASGTVRVRVVPQ